MFNMITDRSFQLVTHPSFAAVDVGNEDDPRLVQQSSAIGDYPDSMDEPGSSFLWVGMTHHLNREQVRELVQRLEHWLATGKLFPTDAPTAPPAPSPGAPG